MQYIVALLAALAVIPVISFGLSIHSSAFLSLLCVGLIVLSLFVMFSPGETEETSH